MPIVAAQYGQTRATGRNYEERRLWVASFGGDPMGVLKQRVPKFAALLDRTNNEGGRSAYSCAEVHAFSELLVKLNWFENTQGTRFADIEFSRATAEEGMELWHPCKNCSVWMEDKGGSGTAKTYKLTAAALQTFS